MQTADKISALRASLAKAGLELPERQARHPLGHPAVDEALRGGLLRGALHEVFAEPGHEAAATGFASALTMRLAGGKTLLWIRQDFSALEFGELSATGFLELGLDPSRILLLRVAHVEDAVRAASDALSCTALGAVVIEVSGESKVLDLVTSRRLTLAAVQANVPALLLRFSAKPDSSTAETRWLVRGEISPAREENWGKALFRTELVRNRHGRTGQWVMEWDCDDCVFRPADRGAMVSAPFDGPAATQMEKAREGEYRSVA